MFFQTVVFLGFLIINFIGGQKRCINKRPLTGPIPDTQLEFMNCWSNEVEHGASDLVILLDSSGSMYSTGSFQGVTMTGFDIGKTFINALLSKVHISFNATRIAIGTFGTNHKIDINFILRPDYSMHKCKFKKDFEKIRIYGGMTNLRGALQDSLNIFRELDSNPDTHKKRHKTNRVVILLSDGEGNVMDNPNGRGVTHNDGLARNPHDIAHNLRLGLVEVYTIGVTSAPDRAVLEGLATEKNLFLFSKDFTDLGNLAHNIRGDPYEHDYETMAVSHSLCGECDEYAECGCNLLSGDYRCVCQRGWYGTAEKNINTNTCLRCPKDTYGDKRGYITEKCKPCPKNSHTVERNIPAMTISECKCNVGYSGTPGLNKMDLDPCKIKHCNPSGNINNGFVKNSPVCNNPVYGTICRYECDPGYKMVGRDFTECIESEDGSVVWSTPMPQCLLISCAANWVGTKSANYFDQQCSKQIDQAYSSFPSGTICTFVCHKKYYQHGGSTKITCLDSGNWDDEVLDCRVSTCPRLPKLDKKIQVINPHQNCFENILQANEQCMFTCPQGYSLVGPKVVECLPLQLELGSWNIDTSIKSNLPFCKDVESPRFAENERCSQNIVIRKSTLLGKSYAEVNFEEINVTDNSMEEVQVICKDENDKNCDYKMGNLYKINIVKDLVIKFEAIDTSGNSAFCRFQIEVIDKEPPVLIWCPPNQRIETTDAYLAVDWEEAKYTDNCGEYPNCAVRVRPSISKGSTFTRDVPVVVYYTAIDPYGNSNEECSFVISVVLKQCPPLAPPKNGLLVKFSTMYQVRCSAGTFPAQELGMGVYICNNGEWVSMSGGPFPIPDCIRKDQTNGNEQETSTELTYEGDCHSKAVQEQIKNEFLKSLCLYCDFDSLEVFCGSASLVFRRKRSTFKTVSIKASVLLKVSKEEIRNNAVVAKQILKNQINQEMPKFINRVKNFKEWSAVLLKPSAFRSVNLIGNVKEVCGDPADIQDLTQRLDERCVVCGAGTFKNFTSNKCEKCPDGMFQPNPGQTKCLSCPPGSIATERDSKDFTSCKELCLPGHYSMNGFSPCNQCPLGTYTNVSRSTSCVKCPTGTTTFQFGATSVFDCGTACLPGTYSANRVEPCLRCPKGQYQDKYGQVKCEWCPDLKTTSSIGSVSVSSCLDINDCSSSPCLNGGHCIDLRDDFRCECQKGFWGETCEKEVDECQLQPCINNGTCLDKFQSYKCICRPGTGGDNCGQVLKKCTTNHCGKNGRCIDLADQKTKCVCNDLFVGEFCEGKVDPCYPDPCSGVGFCEPIGNNFKCHCLRGYTGETCQNKWNFCDSGPCQNNGLCHDKKTGFVCECAPGYHGEQCQHKFNMCVYKKCHNGGVCQSISGDINCLCAPGFSGKQCDKRETEDFDLSFQSTLSPSFSSVHGRKDLSSFSIAFWMRTSNKEKFGTPLSYAVKLENGVVDDNALVLTDYTNFIIFINNQSQSLGFGANDGKWHHIVVTWSSSSGLLTSYKDGVLQKRGSIPIEQGKKIPKGGIFIIGEEQDEFGAGFTPAESFYGDLSQLNVWDYQLEEKEVYNMATKCFHAIGNVIAWSDFNSQSHGAVVKTSPSLACNYQSTLREFQYLKNMKFADNILKNDKLAIQKPTFTSEECSKQCAETAGCHSFIINKDRGCTMLSASPIIDESVPITSYNDDLYFSNCVAPLGMGDKRIPNTDITGMSVKGQAYGHLARLHNVPEGDKKVAFWQPSAGKKDELIEIKLGKLTRITGIATQGHYDENIQEFVSNFNVYYNDMNTWKEYPKTFKANTGPIDVVRNDLNIITDIVRLKVTNQGSTDSIALRIELYGCPLDPQGVPIIRQDVNDCKANPCKNGATCIDLYQAFFCKCQLGYSGKNCESSDCSVNDIDAPIHGLIIKHSEYAEFKCETGYQLVGISQIKCLNGIYQDHRVPQCVDIDECKLKYCSDGCENTIGSFKCYCPIGKILDPRNQMSCYDENECQRNTGCEFGCDDLVGSFSCKCPKGYFHQPGQRYCYDFNECDSSSTNKCEQLCQNTLGSYVCSCRPGYILAPDGFSCIFQKCSDLPVQIKNGVCKVTKDIAVYSCDTGYKLNGVKERFCAADKTWSGSVPFCQPIKCVEIFAPENGQIKLDGFHFNAKATVTCNPNFKLFGSSVRYCTANGWDGMPPYCSVEVCPPFFVLNGRTLGTSPVVGSAVRIECDTGYTLIQQNLLYRTCQSNGQWTGGNQASIECKIIECGPVENTGNTRYEYVGGQKYNNIVKYSCVAGHCLEGSSVRRCQANGKWSDNAPKCISNSCCSPYVPPHSKLYSDNSFSPGEYVYIKCDQGYKSSGTELRICQKELVWSGEDTTCNIVDCGHPTGNQIMKNGEIHMSKTTYLAHALFYCQPGYLIVGSTERICQANGNWSGNVPVCIKDANGGHVRKESGSLVCLHQSICHWLIQVTQGKKITLDFLTYDVQNGGKTEVYDGENFKEPFITFTKGFEPRKITSNSHFIRIISSGYITFNFSESSCGGLFGDSSGAINSPNYPLSYPSNLDCYWTIHRPYNKLQLLFLDFKLQELNVDFVTVAEGPFVKSSLLLSQRYGRTTPWLNKDWVDRWLWIHFHTDSFYVDKGFKAIWKVFTSN
ncbi:sushi, von Willebrand factor type A, EGF and pentraxin domain-containing protein 1 isoform X1 [Hydra vulgaris]|uniref:sushi, von Willebrand factor type A, EGF and pentraxin domain-containing protein 1 isoform X1 n=2 Tax=Hydra vulgaris TaxID=6087 RepID=UPI001F5F6856|nr:sushi, von Willebrand factor type A, EGF and pentraxin domain-containing protein 1 isoform X1 [Hydra vulgaris]